MNLFFSLNLHTVLNTNGGSTFIDLHFHIHFHIHFPFSGFPVLYCIFNTCSFNQTYEFHNKQQWMIQQTANTTNTKKHQCLQDEEDRPTCPSKRQRSRLTEVAAVSTDAISRQNKNEEGSAIYKLSNDELKLCFGLLGQYQYKCIPGTTSHRFKRVYDEAVEGKK